MRSHIELAATEHSLDILFKAIERHGHGDVDAAKIAELFSSSYCEPLQIPLDPPIAVKNFQGLYFWRQIVLKLRQIFQRCGPILVVEAQKRILCNFEKVKVLEGAEKMRSDLFVDGSELSPPLCSLTSIASVSRLEA